MGFSINKKVHDARGTDIRFWNFLHIRLYIYLFLYLTYFIINSKNNESRKR